MDNCPPFAELPDGKANVVVPPKIVSGMTGVSHAKQDKTGTVKLVYVDGTEEVGKVPFDIVQEKNFFRIVEAARK